MKISPNLKEFFIIFSIKMHKFKFKSSKFKKFTLAFPKKPITKEKLNRMIIFLFSDPQRFLSALY